MGMVMMGTTVTNSGDAESTVPTDGDNCNDDYHNHNHGTVGLDKISYNDSWFTVINHCKYQQKWSMRNLIGKKSYPN